jgi:hypothetical protein
MTGNFSNCCDEPLPNYPENDICPLCHEHCELHKGNDDIEEERGLDMLNNNNNNNNNGKT